MGNYKDELLLFGMPFHVALKHDVLTKEIHYHLAVVSHVPATPSGVSNIVKTETSSPVIYTPILWFVFLANISDLLCLSRGGKGVLWLRRLESISNF